VNIQVLKASKKMKANGEVKRNVGGGGEMDPIMWMMWSNVYVVARFRSGKTC
jgi:hypothetical protein